MIVIHRLYKKPVWLPLVSAFLVELKYLWMASFVAPLGWFTSPTIFLPKLCPTPAFETLFTYPTFWKGSEGVRCRLLSIPRRKTA